MKCALSYVCVPILPMYTCLGASYCYKTFSCPHVLFIKGLISTSGSHDEWQKNASWRPQEREQGGIFFCLFRTLKSNFLPAIWAKDSGSQQLLIWEAPVPALWPGRHWHSSSTSESRLAWKSGPAVLFREGWIWVGLLQMAEKNERPTLWRIFLVVDGHSLIIAAPGFLVFPSFPPHLGGVLVNKLSDKGEKMPLICSVCQFPWCKYPSWATNLASLNMELGRQETCVIAFLGPRGAEFNAVT